MHSHITMKLSQSSVCLLSGKKHLQMFYSFVRALEGMMWFNCKCITHLGASRPCRAMRFGQRGSLYYLELPTQLFHIQGKQILRNIKHTSEHAAIHSLLEKCIKKPATKCYGLRRVYSLP